jgi:hypothetical protein
VKYLFQQGDILTKEKSAIRRQGLPFDVCHYDKIELSSNNYIPVGSVEFVTKYCQIHNIPLPDNISYPIQLVSYLGRKIRQGSFGSALLHEFVKPKSTKTFTGGIKHIIPEQVDDLEPVWIADPVEFTSEFRFYIIDKEIVGYSQYDDGTEAQPDTTIVEEMVQQYKDQPIGYSIDIGVVDSKTQLIECNDGWSLGFYPWGTMTESKYIELITKRWLQINTLLTI